MKNSLISAPVLHALRTFAAAARNLSFARAAQELSVTPGAISQQIKLLEERLRCRLFERHARGLSLTAAGSRLALAAESAFCTLEEALATLPDSEVKRALNISCTTSFALMWLMPRLGEFNRLRPDIQLRIKAEFHQLDPAQMRREGAQLAIRYGEGRFPGFQLTDLMSETLMPVASPSYLDRFPSQSLLTNPDGCVFVHDAAPWEGAPAYSEWLEWIDGASAKFPVAGWRQLLSRGHQFNLSQLSLEAAMADQGLAIGRGSLILDDLKSRRLVTPWNQPVLSRARYVLLGLSSDVRDSDAESFTEWLVGACREFEQQRVQVLGL
jgi:LysR family transcriptional regulator, glycine cleavage system transcriptional activator